MTVETEVAALTTAVNSLTSTVNVSKATLDASVAAAEAAYDSFDDRYLGVKSSAPSTDNDGGALLTGALYFNSTSNTMFVFTGSGWNAVAPNNLINPNVALTQDLVTNGNDIKFGDNDKATFGVGDALQIYHASAGGGHSYIKEIGTGNLRIQGADITLQDPDGNGFISMVDSGAGGTVYLKHSGSNVLATTATGISVTGGVDVNGPAGSSASLGEVFQLGQVDSAGGFITSVDWATSVYKPIQYRASSHSFLSGTSQKLNVNSTGIDITGTATMDLLTISGTNGTLATFDRTGSNGVYLALTDNSGSNVFLGNSGGQFQVQTAGASYSSKLTVESNGDVSFYEDTGTTPKLFWDASAESLGIGTSSPADKLNISGGGVLVNTTSAGGVAVSTSLENGAAQFKTLNSNLATPAEQFYVGNNLGDVDLGNKRGGLKFFTGTTEKMRIDSSGNLLVGTTNANNVSDGIRLKPDGFISAANTSGPVLYANRLSTDGSILSFQKDGTTVGTIGVALSDNLYFSGVDAGIGCGTGALYPASTTGQSSDNDTDLGTASTRFKDLYLSGGVYLGGVGADNKLDDYEQGDYLAAVTMGSGTLTLNTSFNRLSYTKVGRLVTVTGLLIASAGSGLGGSVRINLPFTCASLTGRAADSAGSLSVVNSASCASGSFGLRVTEGSSSAYIFDGSGTTTTDAGSSMASNVQLYLSITYATV